MRKNLPKMKQHSESPSKKDTFTLYGRKETYVLPFLDGAAANTAPPPCSVVSTAYVPVPYSYFSFCHPLYTTFLIASTAHLRFIHRYTTITIIHHKASLQYCMVTIDDGKPALISYYMLDASVDALPRLNFLRRATTEQSIA
jgi:hypothetical protein